MGKYDNYRMGKDRIYVNNERLYVDRNKNQYADVRNNVCKLAEDKNMPIEITCDEVEGRMTILPENLRNFDKVSKEYPSQYVNGSPYKLISYKWNPD